MIKSFQCDIVGFVITSLGVKIICASNIVMLFLHGLENYYTWTVEKHYT